MLKKTDIQMVEANWKSIYFLGGLFESLENVAGNSQTRLCGLVTDQAALYGLLKKVRDLGLPLVSVNRIVLSKEKNS